MRHAPSAALAALLALAASAAAEPPPALSGDGDLLRVRSGLAGDLLPDAGDGADHDVLLLERIGGDGSVEALVVPGTDDPAAETAVGVYSPRDREEAEVVWWKGPDLWSATLGAEGFGAARLLHSDSRGIQPRLSVTTSSWELPSEAGGFPIERSVLHLVWWDPDAEALLYRPIAVGEDPATAPIFLTDVVDVGGGPLPDTGVPDPLRRAFDLHVTPDKSRVVVSLVQELAGAIDSIVMEVLPPEVAHLKGHVADEVLEEIEGTAGPAALAERMRIEIIGMGARYGFDPELLSWIATGVETWVLEAPAGTTPEELALGAGALVGDLLAEVFGATATRAAGEQILRELFLGDPERDPVLQVVRVASWGLPEVSALASGPPTGLFGSTDGRRVAVAWYHPETKILGWTSASAAGWNEQGSLRIGSGLDLGTAIGALRDRLR